MYSSPLAQPHRWICASRISIGYTGWLRVAKEPAPSQENHSLPDADGDGFGAAGYVELGEDRGDVEFHRVLGTFQFPGNVLVGEPLGEQAQHFDLARRERRTWCFRRSQSSAGDAPCVDGVGMKDDQPLGGSFNRDRDLARGSLQRQYCPKTGAEAGSGARLFRVFLEQNERRSRVEPGIERFFQSAPPR